MPRKTKIITAKIVPESQRLDVADHFFGIRYPLVLEPTVYQFASQLAIAYKGAFWEFQLLSNEAFLMTPKLEESFKIVADNGYKGMMTADALGITACLYAYSNLSFNEGGFGENCARHYERLFDFAMQHREANSIRSAIN